MGGALLDGDLEVVAHAHREPAGKALPLGPGGKVVAQLAEPGEPGAGIFGGLSRRRYGHQARDAQVWERRQGADGVREPLRDETVLALLVAQIDLQEAVERLAARGGLAVEGLGDLRPVDGVDGPEQLDRRPDLVALQRTDQVPLDLLDVQLAVLGDGLLHPVLAEDAQAGRPGFGHQSRGLSLARAHQGDAAGRTSATPAGFLDTVTDPGEALRHRRVVVHGLQSASAGSRYRMRLHDSHWIRLPSLRISTTTWGR